MSQVRGYRHLDRKLYIPPSSNSRVRIGYDPRYHPTQLDIPYSSANFFTLPENLPGRLNTDDFIFFKWQQNINPMEYDVIISSNDTAGSPWRNLGSLNVQIKLPEVYFDADSQIGVVPKRDSSKPSFWGRLNRASTYSIPLVKSYPALKYNLERHGVLTAAVGKSNLA